MATTIRTKATPLGRILRTILIFTLFIIPIVVFWGNIKDFLGIKIDGTSKGNADITVGVVTWPGYIGGEYMNNGFEATKDCRYFKDYGIQVEFKILDDFVASRKAFEADEVDLLWCTVDALPTEMGSAGTMSQSKPKFLFQSDWSRGGDAIVVTADIENVSDLKGQKIAVAEGTPSHTYLINLLEANGMTLSDVIVVSASSAVEAANMFKQGAVKCAVVWSPDDIDCVSKVTGAKVLSSTKDATYIIADGFIAKEKFVEDNLDILQKLYDGWMVGAAEINADKNGAKDTAAKILADKFQMKISDAKDMIDNVRLTTHGDNLNFFGLDDSKAVTGDYLYTKMSAIYENIKMVENPVLWRDVVDSKLIKASTLTSTGDNAAETSKKFTKVTEEIKTAKAFSSKKITINFATNSYVLTATSKAIITTEFADIAKKNAGARIRIEGNTDNTGDAYSNLILSKNRAQAVADYLVAQYEWDANRFIVVGNGSANAIKAKSYGDDATYRSTEFQLISDK